MPLTVAPDFRSLSVRDLVEARDLYHYHLLAKTNVVGTAIGLYLIRKDDPRPADAVAQAHEAAVTLQATPPAPRTLDGSEIRDYSWPCVIVFVREWADETDFGSRIPPQDAIPKTLFMPDGRTIPVCVVLSPPTAPGDGSIMTWHWPDTSIGGGFPLAIEVQEQTHVATAGAIVSDGHTLYVLTNRHVAGNPGEPIFTYMRGELTPVGVASSLQSTRLPFSTLYPALSSREAFVDLDVGLIRIDDANRWTSGVYGLGELGDLADVNRLTLSLRLIGQAVVASGAASGVVHGTIKALFYRYKSVAGYDYVSDFLIAPGDGEPQTQPGDSGMVWCLEPSEYSTLPQPIALEWGAQSVRIGNDQQRVGNFALATNLSNICQQLDVEFVTSHNTSARKYWGSTGHYGIAAVACDILKDFKDVDAGLGAFFAANKTNVAFATTTTNPKDIVAALRDAKQNGGFVLLADVPDIIWKTAKKLGLGGRDNEFDGTRWTGPEHPNHFADIDVPSAVFQGKTLLELSTNDPSFVTVAKWRDFYASLSVPPKQMGLLPFRISQLFVVMVESLKANDVATYLAAAGTLAHYVGDASQPLHASGISDGYRYQSEDGGKTWPGKGVHSVYEDKMVDDHPDLFEDVASEAKALEITTIPDGSAAAVEAVRLMKLTADNISAKTLVDTYIAAGDRSTARPVRDALWDKFGAATVTNMAGSVRLLSSLWSGAWKAAGRLRLEGAGEVAQQALLDIYRDASFAPSCYIDDIGRFLSE